MKNIFIGGAWPYANNSLHVGHLAALLPGDIIARYYRKKGNKVLYVSGSDCHGTPITIRAEKLGIESDQISTHYDAEFRQNFKDLHFSYDLFANTMVPNHSQLVQDNLKKIFANGYLYEKIEKEDFCEYCNKFRSDREVIGTCPICGSTANGDQCDKCLTALTPDMLKDKTCKTCGAKTTLRDNKHLYFKMSSLSNEINQYFEENKSNWRQTAINETSKYLKEGLRDRAVTRTLEWGIPLPFEGFDDKRVYVWIEAVMGYLSAGKKVCDEQGINFEELKKDKNTLSYYIHGKDNIVFHTIILPALLHAIDKDINKPQMIISSEYVNYNNEKMSKSKGNLISVNSLLANFDADSIRYYFIYNNPERKDSSFNVEDFISVHNKHLVGGFGNFVNRNLAFLQKKFEGKLPNLQLDQKIKDIVQNLYDEIGNLIERGELKESTAKLFDFVQFANKYYDSNTPWIHAKTNLEEFDRITSNCLYMISNMANLYEPFTPEKCKILKNLLGISQSEWKPVCYDQNQIINNTPILFDRLNPEDIDLTKNSGDTFKL